MRTLIGGSRKLGKSPVRSKWGQIGSKEKKEEEKVLQEKK